MRVLYFTKYTRLGASSRLRSYQYFPTLEKHGIKVTVKPLFGDAYLHKLYAGQVKYLLVIKSYLKRLFILFTVFKYDTIVIEKELFPYFPPFFEGMLKLFGVKYVVDYDDAIFHNYDQSKNPIKKLLKNKIRHVMRYSTAVIAGNQYLADYAIEAGAKHVEIIPTVIDVNKYKIKRIYDPETVTIGWIGSPTTLKYLKSIAAVLKELCAQHNINVHIVGSKEGIGLGINEKLIQWSEDTEADIIRTFDIGLMPLTDSFWEKGKCGYKIIQYMGCAVPVVASPVGVNSEIIVNGQTGYLAKTEFEWVDALKKYIVDKTIREEHGKNGRRRVEKNYNRDITALKLIEILDLNKTISGRSKSKIK